VKKIFHRQELDFLGANRDFLVCFDRGDVAWLRANCHLLMGMLDAYLALDTEPLFDLAAEELFAKAPPRRKVEDTWVIPVKEPARLGRCRGHFLKVAALNRETWEHIRAETDDDHEWLPNPRQKGVLALPVRKEMIDAWLEMVAELEALLDGKRVLSNAMKDMDVGILFTVVQVNRDLSQALVLPQVLLAAQMEEARRLAAMAEENAKVHFNYALKLIDDRGQRAKGIERLKWVVRDFPGTRSAEAAKEKLRELGEK
jgi:hypothetical protein